MMQESRGLQGFYEMRTSHHEMVGLQASRHNTNSCAWLSIYHEPEIQEPERAAPSFSQPPNDTTAHEQTPKGWAIVQQSPPNVGLMQ